MWSYWVWEKQHPLCADRGIGQTGDPWKYQPLHRDPGSRGPLRGEKEQGVRTFRPIHFQPMQFQPLHFQPLTIST